MVKEFDKLSNLKQAINLEQSHLQTLYGIKETAHTLSALTLVQQEQTEQFELKMKETRLSFEHEMEEKKVSWKKQQTILESEYAEKKEKLEKQHKREEGDYNYTLKLSRRQDQQEYTLKKEALEKELEEKRQDLAQKENHLQARLQEFEELKQKVDQFPEELAKATGQAVKEAAGKLEAQYKFSSTLKEKGSFIFRQ